MRCPRVRDRGGAGEAGKIRFTSAILPPYLRRAKSIEELLPWLYLKGISTGDFTEALCSSGAGRAALGLDDHALEGGKASWALGKARPLGPALSLFLGRRDLFVEHDKQCILVIIGADQWGRKELLGAQSLLLERRGLEVAPELAVGGFWRPCARATARRANSAAGCTNRQL